MHTTKILVTGFGPYEQGMKINASRVLLTSLKNKMPHELKPFKKGLTLELIGFSDMSREGYCRTIELRLAELLASYTPEFCIFTGQTIGFSKISIEKIARNSFLGGPICPEGPDEYTSDWPGIDDIPERLKKHGIPSKISLEAGMHVCNHILYSSLRLARERGLSHKSVFVHVPILPEQVRIEYGDSGAGPSGASPCMTLEKTRKAICLIIEHLQGNISQDGQR